MKGRRVVSLLPSATEMVAALGAIDALVGRSHECDFPPGVEALPACTRALIDASAPSAGIQAEMEKLLESGSSLYGIEAELVKELAPTHIVTQVQCEVCAVSLADVEAALVGWSGQRPQVVTLGAVTLQGVLEDVRRLADALEIRQKGDRLAGDLSRRWSDVAERASRAAVRPSVAAIEWLAPLMAAGNWMPEMVEMAGGRNLFGQPGSHSDWLAWDDLRRADPDVVVLLPCGFPLERVEREAGVLAVLPGWNKLSAVAHDRVYLTEANQLFNRPGPRLAESLEALAQMLHPGLFGRTLEGIAWRRLAANASAPEVPPQRAHNLA
ncbi:MAG TPA: ABC transporter substrate-binding protein [Thermoanaerobaculia bacterium]|nr:ABC transporter substrate-binding protein [Thermoanaerobaculia bacterium]